MVAGIGIWRGWDASETWRRMDTPAVLTCEVAVGWRRAGHHTNVTVSYHLHVHLNGKFTDSLSEVDARNVLRYVYDWSSETMFVGM